MKTEFCDKATEAVGNIRAALAEKYGEEIAASSVKNLEVLIAAIRSMERDTPVGDALFGCTAFLVTTVIKSPEHAEVAYNIMKSLDAMLDQIGIEAFKKLSGSIMGSPDKKTLN